MYWRVSAFTWCCQRGNAQRRAAGGGYVCISDTLCIGVSARLPGAANEGTRSAELLAVGTCVLAIPCVLACQRVYLVLPTRERAAPSCWRWVRGWPVYVELYEKTRFRCESQRQLWRWFCRNIQTALLSQHVHMSPLLSYSPASPIAASCLSLPRPSPTCAAASPPHSTTSLWSASQRRQHGWRRRWVSHVRAWYPLATARYRRGT